MKGQEKNKTKKDTSGVRAFFYIYLGITFIGLMLAVLRFGSADITFPVTVLFGMFFFFFTKFVMVPYESVLRDENGKRLKKENKKALIVLFGAMLICTALYISRIDLAGSGDFVHFVSSCVQLVIWILPCMLYLFMVVNLMATGKVNIFFSECIGFIKEYVSVYLVYRAIIFAVTLISSVIMVIILRFKGDVSDSLIVSGYFQYILDASLTDTLASGFLSGEGTFMSGLTAASSYMVLSSFALEYINGNAASFAERLKGMFFEKDTIKLLVMSIICIIATVVPSVRTVNFFDMSVSKVSVLVFLLMWGMWLLSMVSFVKETKPIPYLLNFFTLYFVERIVILPSAKGFAGFIPGVALTVIRIGLFALISMMIALFEKSEYASPEQLVKDGHMDGETFEKTKSVGKSVLKAVGILFALPFLPLILIVRFIFRKTGKNVPIDSQARNTEK